MYFPDPATRQQVILFNRLGFQILAMLRHTGLGETGLGVCSALLCREHCQGLSYFNIIRIFFQAKPKSRNTLIQMLDSRHQPHPGRHILRIVADAFQEYLPGFINPSLLV